MKRCVWCFVLAVVLSALSMSAWAVTNSFRGFKYYDSSSNPILTTGLGACQWKNPAYTLVLLYEYCGSTRFTNTSLTGGSCCLNNTTPQGGNYISDKYCYNDLLPTISSTGLLSCSSSANTCNEGYSQESVIDGTGGSKMVCVPTCASGETFSMVAGFPTCSPPPCPENELAHVSCTSAATTACLDGCLYSVSAGTQTSIGFFGSAQSSGSTCTASGCSEVTQQERDAICTGTEASLLLRQVLCDVTAQPCPEGQIPSPAGCAEPLPDGCIAIEGETICAEADQNCVVVAGQRVCAEVPQSELDREGCFWAVGLGEWICPTDTAVTSTTGTTTSVVDPVTGNITTTTTSTTTNNVNNKSTTTTTTVVTDAEGNEISRESVETKTGSEFGSLVAREPGELGEKADLDWLMTEEEVKTAWADRWEAAPIVAAVSSFSTLSLTSVEGSCPEFCLPLWGESLCTTAHCEIWETISAVLTGVFLALYGMTAMRIVLSA